ncbi:MAG: hypothetical protein P8Z30_12350, partial [Acidobacteriota bacterium]
MNRIRVRSFLFLAAAFAALCFPALLLAQKPRAVPKAEGQPVMVPAPAWQKGDYWSKFDHQLMVDFGNLARFHDADLKLGPPAPGQDRVVFMGDSI